MQNSQLVYEAKIQITWLDSIIFSLVLKLENRIKFTMQPLLPSQDQITFPMLRMEHYNLLGVLRTSKGSGRSHIYLKSVMKKAENQVQLVSNRCSGPNCGQGLSVNCFHDLLKMNKITVTALGLSRSLADSCSQFYGIQWQQMDIKQI